MVYLREGTMKIMFMIMNMNISPPPLSTAIFEVIELSYSENYPSVR